ncbi:MAG: hypothetical protein J5726_07525 [Treponema sp.]|nr:hypothetical protein [Treponema sp.]
MAAAVLLGTMALTGCMFSDETYDTWYKYDGDIKNLPVADAGTAAGADGMMENAQLYVKYNGDEGLTICVVTTTKQTISCAGGLVEIPDVEVAVGGEKKFAKSEFGPTRWNILVRLADFIEEDPPKYNNVPELTANFNLRRILLEFLINTLGA